MYGMNQPGSLYGQTVPPQIPPMAPMNNPAIYPQVTRNVLPGRTVEKVEDIVVGEVPNDGSLGLFPQKDGSCIYTKAWNADGTIRTMKFVPVGQDDSVPRQESVQQAEDDSPTIQDILSTIQSGFNDIMDFLTSEDSKKSKDNSKNQNGSNSTKE